MSEASQVTQTIIGLTGSIGMGKTTTAKLFADEGIPVWDADAAVHRLYNDDQNAIGQIAEICPVATRSGVVDRGALKEWIAINPDGLKLLEKIIHPMIAADRTRFLETNAAQTVVLDIPLLFEIGLSETVDAIVVVTAPTEVQRQRVLGRGIMTEKQFKMILSKQLPDADKCARADYIVESTSLEHAKAQVQNILKSISEKTDA